MANNLHYNLVIRLCFPMGFFKGIAVDFSKQEVTKTGKNHPVHF